MPALRERLDGLAGRDELAALRERLGPAAATSSPSLARARTSSPRCATGSTASPGGDEVAALRERARRPCRPRRVAAFAGHDDLAALRERLDGLAARDELTGFARQDELAALQERLDSVAARDEVAALRERLDALGNPEDGGVAQEAHSLAREALDRITVVDRGADTVLADVKALRGLVDEAFSLAQGAQEAAAPTPRSCARLIARHGGELEVTRGQAAGAETEALGARQAASAAAEAAEFRPRGRSYPIHPSENFRC